MEVIETAAGVKIGVKMLTIGERFSAFKIIPADDQGNPLRMAWIFSALSVRDIDGIPVPRPGNIDDVTKLIERLGDDGLNEVQKFIVESQVKVPAEAKN